MKHRARKKKEEERLDGAPVWGSTSFRYLLKRFGPNSVFDKGDTTWAAAAAANDGEALMRQRSALGCDVSFLVEQSVSEKLAEFSWACQSGVCKGVRLVGIAMRLRVGNLLPTRNAASTAARSTRSCCRSCRSGRDLAAGVTASVFVLEELVRGSSSSKIGRGACAASAN